MGIQFGSNPPRHCIAIGGNMFGPTRPAKGIPAHSSLGAATRLGFRDLAVGNGLAGQKPHRRETYFLGDDVLVGGAGWGAAVVDGALLDGVALILYLAKTGAKSGCVRP